MRIIGVDRLAAGGDCVYRSGRAAFQLVVILSGEDWRDGGERAKGGKKNRTFAAYHRVVARFGIPTVCVDDGMSSSWEKREREKTIVAGSLFLSQERDTIIDDRIGRSARANGEWKKKKKKRNEKTKPKKKRRVRKKRRKKKLPEQQIVLCARCERENGERERKHFFVRQLAGALDFTVVRQPY